MHTIVENVLFRSGVVDPCRNEGVYDIRYPHCNGRVQVALERKLRGELHEEYIAECQHEPEPYLHPDPSLDLAR